MVKGDMCGVAGGMHSKGQHVWQGGMGGMGACMAKRCVCQGYAWLRACMAGEMCMAEEGVHSRGVCMAGETATAADSMHATGMHSCSLMSSQPVGPTCNMIRFL